MLRIIDTTLRIRHLSRPLTIVQITDLHLTFADGRDKEYVNRLSKERLSFFPKAAEVFESIRQYLRENPPDYTILTGDIIDFPSKKNLDILQTFLRDDIARFLYIPGNHDWSYPFEEQSDATHRSYYPEFAPLTGGTPDFQVIDAGGVLLIGLDDTCCQITAEQLEKLKKELEKKIPCLLFMHIPIYIDTLIDDIVRVWRQPIVVGTPREAFAGTMHPDLVPTAETAEFCRLIAGDDSPVAGIISGHVHFSHSDSFGGNKIQHITELSCGDGSDDGTVRLIRLVGDRD